MAFLTLMGIEVPALAEGSGEISIVNVGEYGRAFSGTPISSVRARGSEYKGKWPLVPRATSTAYRRLVQGDGQSFRFNAAGSGASAWLYTSTGQALAILDTANPQTFIGGGPLGPRLVLAANDFLSCPSVPTTTGWTFATWLKSAAGTSNAWKHYVVEYTSFGASTGAWRNGAPIALGTLPNDLEDAASGGSLFLGTSTEQVQYAEMMLLPFQASLLSSGWASWVYNGGSTRAAEDLPYLTMGGAWTESGSDSVLGEVPGEQLRDVVEGGSTVQYGTGDFTLRSRNLAR